MSVWTMHLLLPLPIAGASALVTLAVGRLLAGEGISDTTPISLILAAAVCVGIAKLTYSYGTRTANDQNAVENLRARVNAQDELLQLLYRRLPNEIVDERQAEVANLLLTSKRGATDLTTKRER